MMEAASTLTLLVVMAGAATLALLGCGCNGSSQWLPGRAVGGWSRASFTSRFNARARPATRSWSSLHSIVRWWSSRCHAPMAKHGFGFATVHAASPRRRRIVFVLRCAIALAVVAGPTGARRFSRRHPTPRHRSLHLICAVSRTLPRTRHSRFSGVLPTGAEIPSHHISLSSQKWKTMTTGCFEWHTRGSRQAARSAGFCLRLGMLCASARARARVDRVQLPCSPFVRRTMLSARYQLLQCSSRRCNARAQRTRSVPALRLLVRATVQWIVAKPPLPRVRSWRIFVLSGHRADSWRPRAGIGWRSRWVGLQ